jgi:hypothetical protein
VSTINWATGIVDDEDRDDADRARAVSASGLVKAVVLNGGFSVASLSSFACTEVSIDSTDTIVTMPVSMVATMDGRPCLLYPSCNSPAARLTHNFATSFQR